MVMVTEELLLWLDALVSVLTKVQTQIHQVPPPHKLVSNIYLVLLLYNAYFVSAE